MKNLPAEERPRERLFAHGPDVLTASELIAIILGSGIRGKPVLTLAQEILSHFGSLSSLQEASIEQLCQVKGLGKVKAIQLKAALSLASRVQREVKLKARAISSPKDAYYWVRDQVAYEKKEVFGVILQDARGIPMKWKIVSIGTLTQTIIHPREVFHPAIQHLSASLILVHNHPSGDPSPSPQDFQVTRQLIRVSQSVGIPIYDHLIIAPTTYYSMREHGLRFSG
ncbi:MAG: hypothetical protein K940chlam9_00311 [Chlamydiae bacterium]|nr:hypothetical protein [Chlamydiota bacterium]